MENYTGCGTKKLLLLLAAVEEFSAPVEDSEACTGSKRLEVTPRLTMGVQSLKHFSEQFSNRPIDKKIVIF